MQTYFGAAVSRYDARTAEADDRGKFPIWFASVELISTVAILPCGPCELVRSENGMKTDFFSHTLIHGSPEQEIVSSFKCAAGANAMLWLYLVGCPFSCKMGEPVLQSSIFSTPCVLANANVQNAIHSLMIETNRHGEVIFHQYLKSHTFFFGL